MKLSIKNIETGKTGSYDLASDLSRQGLSIDSIDMNSGIARVKDVQTGRTGSYDVNNYLSEQGLELNIPKPQLQGGVEQNVNLEDIAGGFKRGLIQTPINAVKNIVGEDNVNNVINNPAFNQMFGNAPKTQMGQQAQQIGQNIENIARPVALTGLSLLAPQLSPFGKIGNIAKGLNLGVNGAITGGLSEAGNQLLQGQFDTNDIKNNALIGGGFGLAGAGLLGAGKLASGIGKNTLKSYYQTAGIPWEAAQQAMKTTSRVFEEGIGSGDFLNSISQAVRNAGNTVRNFETKAFNSAKNSLLKNNPANINSKTLFSRAEKELVQKRLSGDDISTSGYGGSLKGKLLDIIETYKKNPDLSLDDLQFLKSNELDSIINYNPQAGMKLDAGEKAVQKIAKGLRNRTNKVLQRKLGSEYKAINKQASQVQELLDRPTLTNILNGKTEDVTSSALKNILGNTKTQTQRDLAELQMLLKNYDGIDQLALNALENIRDYNAAVAMDKQVMTGLGGGFSNHTRNLTAVPSLKFIQQNQPAIQLVNKGGKFARKSSKGFYALPMVLNSDNTQP